MQNKVAVTSGLVLFTVLGAGAWYYHNQHSQMINPGEPQKSGEEVLQERAKQAGTHLNTPLGRAVEKKDWATVSKLYEPSSQYLEMAEIVRALFIENKITSVMPAEQDTLLGFLLQSLDKLEDKNLHLTGLLVTEIERLPSPSHASGNHQILKNWLSDAQANPLKKRIAIEKLALQDLQPDSRALEIYRSGLIQGPTYGTNRNRWIQLIEDTRSIPEQKKSAEYLLKHFKQMPSESQPAALVVLSHHLELDLTQIKQLTLRFLQSTEIDHFESSLRAIGNLLSQKQWKSAEKELIVKKLTSIPRALSTPFAEAKSKELLSLLRNK